MLETVDIISNEIKDFELPVANKQWVDKLPDKIQLTGEKSCQLFREYHQRLTPQL